MKRYATLLLLAAATVLAAAEVKRNEAGLRFLDELTLAAEKSLLDGYAPTNDDGTINVVVEIPAGASDKWEVKPDGLMHWDMKDGKPRIVQYLPYPANYGMVPRTVLPKAIGGDGDPLDVLVLGPASPRGAIVKARVIGVMKLLDKGEVDDKILAVAHASPFAEVKTLAELNEQFRGVTTIIETWFANYKGLGVMESKGFADVDEAMKVLDAAVKAYTRR